MDSKHIIYTIEDSIGILRVNRPNSLNALNWDAQEQFALAIEQAHTDHTNGDLRALIITGTGDRVFVAGGDIKEHIGHLDVETARRLNRIMGNALPRLTQLPCPTVAAINGDAYGGGCEIITACDLRYMVDTARLHFVQVKVGLTTGWGGAARLVRLIGQSRALEILLSGRNLTSEEAYQIGLIHREVPHNQDLLTVIHSDLEKLLALPNQAQAALKQLVYSSYGLALEEAYALEATLFEQQWPHPDHAEAMTAFVEKRKPRFNQQNDGA
jgi:enoyl-CoA hydratase